MRCFSRTLKSLVREAFRTLGDATTKIQDRVNYWTATRERRLKFLDLSRQLGVPSGKKMIYSNDKDWDSLYYMLKRACKYSDVFKSEKLSDSGYTCIPTEEDWNLAKEVCGPLKLFHDSAMYVFDDEYYTADDYFPKVCDIKLALSQWATSEIEVVRNMASKMIANFDEYWNEVNTILAVADVLDPRYKMHIVEYYFSKIYKDEAQGEINRIRKVCNELFKEYHTKVGLGKPSEHINSASGCLGINREDKKDPMHAFDLFVTERKKESVTTELDYYLDDEVVQRTDGFDILLWWHKNGLKYPTLKTIARDILAIPGAKEASIAMFCTDDNVLEKNFDKLSERIIKAIMCKRNWLTAEFTDCNIPFVLEDDEDSDYESP